MGRDLPASGQASEPSPELPSETAWGRLGREGGPPREESLEFMLRLLKSAFTVSPGRAGAGEVTGRKATFCGEAGCLWGWRQRLARGQRNPLGEKWEPETGSKPTDMRGDRERQQVKLLGVGDWVSRVRTDGCLASGPEVGPGCGGSMPRGR